MGDWQAMINDQLIGTGFMHSACIAGKDGSYWAYGGDYVPQPEEVTQLASVVCNPDAAQACGFKIAAQKYFTLRATDGCVIGKLGTGGASVAASETAVVVGVYGEGVNPADCNAAVEAFAKYLKDSGY